MLSQITFTSQNLEEEALFGKQIVGNENSTVSQTVKQLSNSDWIKEGLQTFTRKQIQENSIGPFCQEKLSQMN